MKKAILLFFFLSFLFLGHANAEILITEIMADNGVFVDGEDYDWIEIYNSGSKKISLNGYGLSDRKKQPLLWQFPENAVLEAGEYALIYCTGEDGMTQYPKRNTFYAPFKLSADGETVLLADAAGEVLDSVKYPKQFGNITYGLSLENGEWGFFEEATPKQKNAAAQYPGIQSQRPIIDQAAGFYTLEKGETLEITLSGEGSIHYTLDGSDPTRQSPVYTGPLSLEKTTVIRARVCQENMLMSPSVGSTFIINDPSPVPVISLSTDEKYLFDPKTGVLVRGSNKQSNYMYDWEYPIHFEYFDVEGNRQLAQNGSFCIQGNSSRGNKQKSLGIFARTAYGDENRFYYNPFDSRDYESYRSFLLRGAGSDARSTRMRDVVYSSLAEGLDLMYQAAQATVVYLNGEYYGHYNLREKVNKHSIAQWEGITDPEIIDQIDIVVGMVREGEVLNGSGDDWLALREFVKTQDLNNPENLQYVLDRLDVDNFFTWVSMELGVLNADLENVRMYRVPGGKWKYILYDIEGGGFSGHKAVYMLMDSSKAGGEVSSQYSLLKNLLKVPEMKDRFLKRFAYVMEHSFLYETVVDPVFDKWEATLEQLLPRHIEKFPQMTIPEWRTNVRAVRYYIRVNPKKTINLVCDILNLSKAEEDAYFGRVRELMNVQNAKDKE